MIMRQARDGWLEFYREQGDPKPFFRCKPPEGLTRADIERVRAELLKLVDDRKVGAS
jgi:hypothetical protein